MNVQQTIITGIREQLFFHDYLVLPHFGGFVLKSKHAHFSGASSVLPPSKTVSFNAQLKQNDGVLTVWLQNRLKCTASEALNHLSAFAEYCTSVLNTKRRLTIDQIGFFYLDFENNLCFEPLPDINFLTDSFGLSAVSFKEILVDEIAQPQQHKRETVFIDRQVNPQINKVKSRRINLRTITTVLALLLLTALLLSVVANTRMTGQLRASLFGNIAPGLYQPVTYAALDLIPYKSQSPVYVADANGIAVLNINNEKDIAVKAVHTLKELKLVNNLESGRMHVLKSNSYEIVLGCFGVFQNAKRMAASVSEQNIPAEVADKNDKGLFTVSTGNFSSKDEALLKLQEIQKKYPKAWIKNP